MIIFVELTEEEKDLVKLYAQAYGMTVQEAFKIAMLEKIEKERNTLFVRLAFAEHIKKKMENRSLKEIMEELGL